MTPAPLPQRLPTLLVAAQRHLALLVLLALCLAACGSPRAGGAAAPPATTSDTAATPSTHAAELIRQASRTLREMRAASPRQSLDYWLEDARGVIILPGVYQAGFFYSLHGGEGVVLARKTDGTWSSPAFMSVGGAGYGLQAGLEKSRVLLVINEQEALAEILANGLSLDFSAKYDIVSVREVTGPDSLTRGKPVVAVSDGVGIMAGIAVRGGMLTENAPLGAGYYGQGLGRAQAIFLAGGIPGLEVLELWDALRVNLSQQVIQHAQ